MAKTICSTIVLLFVASLSIASGHDHEGNHDHHDHHHENDNYIELSYILNNQTLHWISLKDIAYKVLMDGKLPRGTNKTEDYYVKIDRIEMDLHSGTHMDAPIHFSEGKWSIDQIPLNRLMNVPAHVIDLSNKCKINRTYEITRADIEDFERKRQSNVTKNSVVLFYTSISDFWSKGAVEYFGTDSKEYSMLKIPGISKEAATFLVKEREIVGVGLDSPSADGTSSIDAQSHMDPVAHEIFNSANVYILENVNGNLKKLINETNIRISTLPLLIETASGTPVRLVAQIDNYHMPHQLPLGLSTSAATTHLEIISLSSLIIICFTLTQYFAYLNCNTRT